MAAVCAAVPATAPAKPQDLKVMVRNVYIGADLIHLAGAGDRSAFEQAAAETYVMATKTNAYSKRAKAIAREVRRHKPDVIGLQEAATWWRGPKDGAATQASKEVYDSTKVLLKELRRAGQRYRVVVRRQWFNMEAPTTTFDARVAQNDVILARRGSKVKWGKTFRGGFEAHFDPPTVVGTAQQLRGWVGVDGKLAGRRFRLVTTHLEAYVPAIGESQMKELLAGPLKPSKTQAILMGDLNSDPSKAGTDDRDAARTPSAYAAAMEAGFVNPLPRRETCCFAEDLRPTIEPLDSWIDHILVRPKIKALKSAIVGSQASERVGGLWPSDHAGIAATLRLSRR